MEKNNSKDYNDKWFYFGLTLIACIFGIFYAAYVNCFDTPLHSLVAKAILFQDVEYDMEGFPIHAYAYPLYHITQKIVHLILQVNYETAAAFILPISIVVSVLLYRKLVMMIVEDTVYNRYFADIVSLGTVVFGVARCWLNDWRYYQFQCGPNPFHNPTILFVRPFAIASFIFFLKYVRTYKQAGCYKYAALFSVVTLLSVGAKPNYAVVFLPAMGIYTLHYMICNKDLHFGIIAFAAVMPSLILLIIQQRFVASHTTALDTVIQFGGFSGLDASQVIAASIVTFPVVILLFRIRLMKSPAFFISITALVVGWLQMYLLSSGNAGDFSWGYDLAVQFGTLVALAETQNRKESHRSGKIIRNAAYILFAYQIVSGIKYLWEIYTSAQFWI
jgi:hypothetical protein